MRREIIATVTALLLTCQSYEPPPVSEYKEENRLQRLIYKNWNDGEILKAVQYMKLAESLGQYSDFYDEEWPLLVADMRESYLTAIEEENWSAVMAYSDSFKNIDIEMPAIDTSVNYLKSLIENSYEGAVGIVLGDDFSWELVDDELLLQLANSVAGYQVKTVLTSVDNELKKRGLETPPKVTESLKEVTIRSDLPLGTVTVIVEKGLTMEQGVAYPNRSIGSGFFIDSRGHFLTNYHVIESEVNPAYRGYTKAYIKPTLESYEKIPAKVIGWDKNTDLALLKAEVEPSYVFSFVSKEKFLPGDRVLAIGSPGGLSQTITSGTISALSRRILPLSGSMQIDVPVNPGSSGGPLLNEEGEVIGIVFAGIDQFQGVNFAIPGKYAARLLPWFYQGGAYTHPWAGVALYQGHYYLEVAYVYPESPAAGLGLQMGDKIMKLNGIEINSLIQIRDTVTSFQPDTLVSFQWLRGEETMEGILSLSQRPDSPLLSAMENDVQANLIPLLIGTKVEPLKKNQYQVLSSYPGTVADELNINRGDTFQLRKMEIEDSMGAYRIEMIYNSKNQGYLSKGLSFFGSLESDVFI